MKAHSGSKAQNGRGDLSIGITRAGLISLSYEVEHKDSIASPYTTRETVLLEREDAQWIATELARLLR
jgi:hypothetical protein